MLNTSQRLVNKNSLTWWYIFKTSWRCLQDVLARRLKTSWKRLEGVLNTYGQDKYFGLDQKRLEDVFWRCLINKNIFVFIKTSWRRLLKTKTKDVFQTSSRRLHLDECLLGSELVTISRANFNYALLTQLFVTLIRLDS